MSLPPILTYLLIFIAAALPLHTAAADEQPGKLSILTSYPPEFYQPFIEGFKSIHPSIQFKVLNKKTTAALDEIQKGNKRKFDLFWSSSLDAFSILKTNKKLQQSRYEPLYRTLAMEGIPVHDPQRYFYVFALSGVGFMWDNHYLKENGLPEPKTWHSLTDPIYYGHLAMSTPSRSGTTHLIVESILQSMGWKKGWAYLLITSGNLATVTARSFSVPEGISSGRFGIGFVIDFLAQGLKCAHPNINFRYGQPTLLMPAGIGLLQNGENNKEAAAFIDFILSPKGQKLLLDPTINRLPVGADIYGPGKPQPPELFYLIQQGKTRPYVTELSRTRYHLVNTLFDQLITYRLLERRRIWKKLIELERLTHMDSKTLAAVKKKVVGLLTEVPVSEEKSSDPRFIKMFFATAAGIRKSESNRRQLETWDGLIDENFRRAQALLDDAWLEFSGQPH